MICIWSSWCHCHPIVSCFIKMQNGFIFLVRAVTYPGSPGKDAVQRVFVCWIYSWCKIFTTDYSRARFSASVVVLVILQPDRKKIGPTSQNLLNQKLCEQCRLYARLRLFNLTYLILCDDVSCASSPPGYATVLSGLNSVPGDRTSFLTAEPRLFDLNVPLICIIWSQLVQSALVGGGGIMVRVIDVVEKFIWVALLMRSLLTLTSTDERC